MGTWPKIRSRLARTVRDGRVWGRAGLIAFLILGACSTKSRPEVELNEEEQRLVREVIDLARIRVERARDQAKSDSLLKELPPLYDDEELEALLDRLAQNTERGAAVMEAIHDSLESLRDVVFPPPSRSGVNRN